MLKFLLILLLHGAGLHSAAAKEKVEISYRGPAVYSNLPPPVLYFPKFSQDLELQSQGSEKRIEFTPFPFKDLPLLVYQSDEQPPIHIVEQNQREKNEKTSQNDSNNVRTSTPEKLPGSKNQPIQLTEFPNLQQQQYISIGLSTLQAPPDSNIYGINLLDNFNDKRQPMSNSKPSDVIRNGVKNLYPHKNPQTIQPQPDRSRVTINQNSEISKGERNSIRDLIAPMIAQNYQENRNNLQLKYFPQNNDAAHLSQIQINNLNHNSSPENQYPRPSIHQNQYPRINIQENQYTGQNTQQNQYPGPNTQQNQYQRPNIKQNEMSHVSTAPTLPFRNAPQQVVPEEQSKVINDLPLQQAISTTIQKMKLEGHQVVSIGIFPIQLSSTESDSQHIYGNEKNIPINYGHQTTSTNTIQRNPQQQNQRGHDANQNTVHPPPNVRIKNELVETEQNIPTLKEQKNLPGMSDYHKKYQHILIHVPHDVEGQPQISILQNDVKASQPQVSVVDNPNRKPAASSNVPIRNLRENKFHKNRVVTGSENVQHKFSISGEPPLNSQFKQFRNTLRPSPINISPLSSPLNGLNYKRPLVSNNHPMMFLKSPDSMHASSSVHTAYLNAPSVSYLPRMHRFPFSNSNTNALLNNPFLKIFPRRRSSNVLDEDFIETGISPYSEGNNGNFYFPDEENRLSYDQKKENKADILTVLRYLLRYSLAPSSSYFHGLFDNQEAEKDGSHQNRRLSKQRQPAMKKTLFFDSSEVKPKNSKIGFRKYHKIHFMQEKPMTAKNVEKHQNFTMPPIIIYKGSKPPFEVYGNKKDIEKTA